MGSKKINIHGDMEIFDWWHDPGLGFDKTIPKIFQAISIGWLDKEDYPRGKIKAEDFKLLWIIK
jgi:hypothetical protein